MAGSNYTYTLSCNISVAFSIFPWWSLAICYLYSSSFWIYYACNFLDINPDFLVIKIHIDKYLFGFQYCGFSPPIIHCRLSNCTRIGYCRSTNISEEIVVNYAGSCSLNRMQDISLVHVIHIQQWCRLKSDPSGVALGFFFTPFYSIEQCYGNSRNILSRSPIKLCGAKNPSSFYNIISCLILWR